MGLLVANDNFTDDNCDWRLWWVSRRCQHWGDGLFRWKDLKNAIWKWFKDISVPLFRSVFPSHRLNQETWYGAKLESFPLLEAASKEPMWAASFMWLEVKKHIRLGSTTYAAKQFSTKGICWRDGFCFLDRPGWWLQLPERNPFLGSSFRFMVWHIPHTNLHLHCPMSYITLSAEKQFCRAIFLK